MFEIKPRENQNLRVNIFELTRKQLTSIILFSVEMGGRRQNKNIDLLSSSVAGPAPATPEGSNLLFGERFMFLMVAYVTAGALHVQLTVSHLATDAFTAEEEEEQQEALHGEARQGAAKL